MNGVGILRILFKEMAKELNVELRYDGAITYEQMQRIYLRK